MRRQLLLSVGLLCVTLLAWLLGWKLNAGVGVRVATGKSGGQASDD